MSFTIPADVYSFAIVCYEIASRQYPFDEYNNDARFCVVVHRGTAAMPAVPDASSTAGDGSTAEVEPTSDDGAEHGSEPVAVTGTTATTELSTHKIKNAIINNNLRPTLPPPEEQCPAWFADLIAACWSNDPRDRPTFRRVLEIFEERLGEAFSLEKAEASAATERVPSELLSMMPTAAMATAAESTLSLEPIDAAPSVPQPSVLDDVRASGDHMAELAATVATPMAPTSSAFDASFIEGSVLTAPSLIGESLITNSALSSVPLSIDYGSILLSRSIGGSSVFNQSFSSLSPMLSSTPYMPSLSLNLDAAANASLLQKASGAGDGADPINYSNEAALVATTPPVLDSVVTAVARARDQIWVAWKCNAITVLSAQVDRVYSPARL